MEVRGLGGDRVGAGCGGCQVVQSRLRRRYADANSGDGQFWPEIGLARRPWPGRCRRIDRTCGGKHNVANERPLQIYSVALT